MRSRNRHPRKTRLITARRMKRPMKKVSTTCREEKHKDPGTSQPRSAPGAWREHTTPWKREPLGLPQVSLLAFHPWHGHSLWDARCATNEHKNPCKKLLGMLMWSSTALSTGKRQEPSPEAVLPSHKPPALIPF